VEVHVTAIVIASLMFIDYALTLAGQAMYRRRYSEFVRIESYELNPVLAASIDAGRYSARHLVSVVAVVTCIEAIGWLVARYDDPHARGTFGLFQGLLLSMFVCILGRHLQNLLVFWAVARDPSLLSGQLHMTMRYTQRAGLAAQLGVALLGVLVVAGQPTWFTLGVALGTWLLALTMATWLVRDRRAVMDPRP
jgi:hypothetical protein